MSPRLLSWWDMCLFRRTPQSEPLSISVMFAALLFYLCADLFQARLGSGWQVAIGATFLDIAVMMIIARLVLFVTGKTQRFVQTLTALAGTGGVLAVIALPLVFMAVKAQQEGTSMEGLAVAWLILLIWIISVHAHIYRHALSSSFGVGLMVSGAHAVIIILLLETLFPRAVS